MRKNWVRKAVVYGILTLFLVGVFPSLIVTNSFSSDSRISYDNNFEEESYYNNKIITDHSDQKNLENINVTSDHQGYQDDKNNRFSTEKPYLYEDNTINLKSNDRLLPTNVDINKEKYSTDSFNGFYCVTNENSILLTINFSTPTIKKIVFKGRDYERITIDDLEDYTDPGSPILPVKPLFILLPPKSKIGDIEVYPATEKQYIQLNHLIEPAPIQIPISSADSIVTPISPINDYTLNENKISDIKPYPQINGDIYETNTLFPEKSYDLVGVYDFRGYSILVLNLFPVRYNPVEAQIEFCEKLELNINILEEDHSNELLRGLNTDREKIIDKVCNPTVVNRYEDVLFENPLYGDSSYEYIIITTDYLKNVPGPNNFTDLINSKISRGITATIITIEDIESNPIYWDSNPIFNDTQAQIRNFIKHAYINFGTEYILLGGDSDDGAEIVPARKLYVDGENMPSDMYYACLDGSYNGDGDALWGEPTDGPGGSDVDLVAEVYVGRACVDDANEMFNFVHKTLAYDSTTDPYLEEVLMAGECLWFGGEADWGGNHMDEMINGSSAHGYSTVGIPGDIYNISTLYDRDGVMTKTTLDLSDYLANQPNAKIGFILQSNSGVEKAGLYVDDVEVKGDGTTLFFDNMDGGRIGGVGNWYHYGTNDEWENGTPVITNPIFGGVPHSGVNCWATDLDNTYNSNSDQWLISPTIDLTGITDVNFTFYSWYCLERYCNDYIYFAFSPDNISWYGISECNINGWEKYEMMDIMNNGIHLINHLGHANSDIVMKMWIPSYRSTVNDVENLTNDQYFFVYSQGCYAGSFDNPSGIDCIAEEFTCSEHGAFAVIMNARYGYGAYGSTDGASQRYDREFWDAVFGEGMRELGRANQDSKEDNIWRINEGVMRWCCYETNLLGDPELTIKLPSPPEKDVGVYSINSPLGYHSLGSYQINSTIKNYGTQSQSFDVNCSIFNSTTLSMVYFDEKNINLLPGEKNDMEFAKSWVVNIEGEYILSITTKLVGDEYPVNDHKNITVYIYNIDDASVVSLNYPTGTLIEGLYNVNATVKNDGTVPLSTIPVNCSIYQAQMVEDFEGLSSDIFDIPVGWTTVDFVRNGGTGYWLNSYYGHPHSGSKWMYGWGYGYTPDCWLMTQQITVPTNGKFSFWYAAESVDYPVAFEVKLSTGSQTDPLSYSTLLWDSGLFDDYNYQECVIDLAAYEGLDVYIGFHFYAASDTYWGLYLDDISVYSSFVYSDDKTVSSLGVDESGFVEFDSWNAFEGDYIIKVSTRLVDDENPANDAKEGTVTIVKPLENDTGVVSINHPTGLQPVGSHTVNATVKNYGNLSQVNVPVNCSIYNTTPTPVFSDDVESGQDGWYTIDNSGYGDLWHITTTNSHSTSHSWYCADEITGQYYDNMENWLVSPSIDLSGCHGPSLRFWLSMNTESCCDPLRLSIYDGSSYTVIEEWRGYYDWTEIIVDLSQFAGRTIQLNFILQTDGSVTYSGIWIDDIEVRKLVKDDLIYSDESTVNMNVGESVFVEFDPWSADVGTYVVNVSTKLLNDEIPQNDAKEETVDILPSDVYVDDDYTPATAGWGIDHFDTIQKGVNGVLSYGTVYVYDGTYYENVVIDRPLDLLGEHNTGTIVNSNWAGYSFNMDNQHDIRIENFTLVYTSGIQILNSMDIFLMNNNLGNGGMYCYSSNDININNNSMQYIQISSCENVQLCDNSIISNMYLVYNSGSSQNSIKRNSFSNYGSIQIYGYMLEHFIFDMENNDIAGQPIYYYLNQTDRVIDGETVGEIILANCSNIAINNTDISDTYVGIETAFSQDIRITNNTIQSDYGIYMAYSNSYHYIDHNTFSNSGYGIFVDNYCYYNTISNNSISGKYNGIYTYNLIDSEIRDNIIHDNYQNGIQMYSSDGNTIEGNTIYNNNLWGSSGYYGIYLSYCNENIIYNNIFNNSYTNAYDDGINTWNTAKTLGTNIIGGPYLGGNNWSDYHGLDLDYDGLGDTALPYNNGGNITSGGDLHPLISSPVLANDVGVVSINHPSSQELPGTHIMNATVKNYGMSNQNNIVVNCSIYKSSYGVSTAFSDDIDTIAGWTHAANWYHSSYRYNSSSHSWYCGNNITHDQYGNNWNQWLISPSIDLSGYDLSNTYMSFWAYYDTELNYDYMRFGASPNNQSFYYYSGTELTGSSGGWVNIIIPFNSVFVNSTTGTTNIAFWFRSDASVYNYEGCYVDDVIIRGPCLTYHLNYTDEITIPSLLNGEATFEEFPEPWIVSESGDYLVTVETRLIGDELPANDRKEKMVTIGEPDIRVEPDHLDFVIDGYGGSTLNIVDTPCYSCDKPTIEVEQRNPPTSYKPLNGVSKDSDIQDYAFGLGHQPLSDKEESNIPTLDEPLDIPSSWDWRSATYNGITGDWTTVAKNQGGCGSCWDFAAHGALEAIINIRQNSPDLDLDLSEQYILSCHTTNYGCSGWNAYYTYQYMMNEYPGDPSHEEGALMEFCFPYQGDDTVPCSDKCANWVDFLTPITNYGFTSSPPREIIKQMIYEQGPACLSFLVYNDFYDGSPSFDSNGVYKYDGVSSYRGSHQIVAIGYVDTPGNPDYEGYWICKNSWGATWGPWDDGCFGIAYGECDIDQELVWCDYSATQDIYQYLTVFNDGNLDLMVSDVTIEYEIGEQTGWLKATPTSFIVPPSSSAYLKVLVNITLLTYGEYHGYINIYSNDPDENPVVIPVYLTIPIPRIEVNKTVWDPVTESWVESITAEISDVVTFNLTIHNNGIGCNLTNLNITDFLPDCLEYITGSSTPREPDILWGKNLTWLFPDPFPPSNKIFIEFSATIIDTGENVNLVNATALGGIPSMMVYDEDVASVTSASLSIDIPLVSGWNLITIPVNITGFKASNLRENITGCQFISMFDSDVQSFWTYTGNPASDFPILDGHAYLVYTAADSILTLTGTPITTVAVPINTGWNMIGWYHEYDTIASSLRENITGCQFISMFDGDAQSFWTYTGNPASDFVITQGMGLMLYTTTSGVWHGEG